MLADHGYYGEFLEYYDAAEDLLRRLVRPAASRAGVSEAIPLSVRKSVRLRLIPE
jgi:hypothetical protein